MIISKFLVLKVKRALEEIVFLYLTIIIYTYLYNAPCTEYHLNATVSVVCVCLFGCTCISVNYRNQTADMNSLCKLTYVDQKLECPWFAHVCFVLCLHRDWFVD